MACAMASTDAGPRVVVVGSLNPVKVNAAKVAFELVFGVGCGLVFKGGAWLIMRGPGYTGACRFNVGGAR